MWPNLQETAYLVTFVEEILKGKFHFLCSVVLRSHESDSQNLKELTLLLHSFHFLT